LELLVVIVILGLLAAIVGPRYFSQVGKSEVTAAKTQLAAFQQALDAYYLDCGRYPSPEEGLNALVVRPQGLDKWRGPYLQKGVPADPWGTPYIYRSLGQNAGFEIVSLGKDGASGGEGDAADLQIP
jgi:general secretion pathway protein G